jgi:F-type H+-transporting ATPase subunit gamma
MAGGQERILRRRIRSVQSTMKITRAMELIAASRIVRAQGRVEAARPYSEQITHVIANLAGGGSELDSPLLVPREVRRVAYVVLAADRGLCGAYNTSVIRAAERALQAGAAQGREYGLVLVGRKAESYFRFRDYDIDAAFSGFSEQPRYEDAKRVAAAVTGPFEDGRYDRVEVAYTRFVSAGSQVVELVPLMPLDRDELGLADVGGEESAEVSAGYEFEPEPGAILERLLPRYVEARLFAAMLDAAASEQAARQRAMKAATDNAEDLITTYTRRMNRARQDAITTEIMEVVGGAEALRGGEHVQDEPDRLLAEELAIRHATG